MSTAPIFSVKITAMSLPLQILDVDLTCMKKKNIVSNKLVFFIFIYTIGAKTKISAKKYIIKFIELCCNDKIDVDNETILFGYLRPTFIMFTLTD